MSRDELVDSMEHSGQLPDVQSPDKREEEALIYNQLRSFMADQEKELKKSTDDRDKYNNMRDENEKLVNNLLQRMKDQDAFIQKLLSSLLDQNKQDLEECKKYLDQQGGQPSSTAEPGTNFVVKAFRYLTGLLPQKSCQHCEKKDLRISELEDKLDKTSRALEKTDKELRSLKDRLAARMIQMPKPENVENMNSPVNTDGLNQLYDKLRFETTQTSGRIKKETVKDAFRAAQRAVENLEKAIAEMWGVKTSPPQVEKFRQTALENLQLALYHSSEISKVEAFKAVPKRKPSESSAELQLASECYWLGCLMALHSPPRHPHWEQENRGKMSWDKENPWPVFK